MGYFNLLDISEDTPLEEAWVKYNTLLELNDPNNGGDLQIFNQLKHAWEKVKDRFPAETAVYFVEIEGRYYRRLDIYGPSWGGTAVGEPHITWISYNKTPSGTYTLYSEYVSKYIPDSEKVINPEHRKVILHEIPSLEKRRDEYILKLRQVTDDLEGDYEII